MQRQYELCIDFIRNNPFVGLPSAPHNYGWEHWLLQASSNGNVPARLDALTLGIAANNSSGSTNNTASRDNQVREAVLLSFGTGDANSIAQAGNLLKTLPNAAPDAQFALLLVPCRMGATCDGAQSTDRSCESLPNGCTPGWRMQDVVLHEAGDARFGKVVAMADRLLQAIKANDRAEIQRVIFRQ